MRGTVRDGLWSHPLSKRNCRICPHGRRSAALGCLGWRRALRRTAGIRIPRLVHRPFLEGSSLRRATVPGQIERWCPMRIECCGRSRCGARWSATRAVPDFVRVAGWTRSVVPTPLSRRHARITAEATCDIGRLMTLEGVTVLATVVRVLVRPEWTFGGRTWMATENS